MLTRRTFIGAAAASIAVGAPVYSAASPSSDEAVAVITNGAPVKRGRVTLTIPGVAENGLSVFTTIAAESPMTEADHVKEIHIISEKNPVPIIASFFFTPAMAEAKVATNIRLAASQKVTALAVMSDGSLWSDEKDIVVTIAACIDGG